MNSNESDFLRLAMSYTVWLSGVVWINGRDSNSGEKIMEPNAEIKTVEDFWIVYQYFAKSNAEISTSYLHCKNTFSFWWNENFEQNTLSLYSE